MAGGGRRPRRRADETEVSCCIKYLLFGFNVTFWIIGLVILGVGMWAWAEKDMFDNLSKMTDFFLDPALILIIAGAVVFIIGFAGCIGALRENTCLLMFFIVCIAVILLAQVAGGILLFVYKDWVQQKIEDAMKVYIVKYRDDPDLQNVIDWLQDDWLDCCGVQGPNDWDLNIYFNCSSPSRERCGVPFSCCKYDSSVTLRNQQCGYDVRLNPNTMNLFIYTQGCVDAGTAWIDTNLIPVAGVAVGLAIVEIVGICFANNMRGDILAQRAKWHR